MSAAQAENAQTGDRKPSESSATGDTCWFHAENLGLADRWFREHGSGIVFIGRMRPVVRTFIAFPAELPMDKLASVVYRSQAVHPMSVRELDHLLAGARAFNEKAGVTGALLHHQGIFLQYFEGPRESVERVYARIRRSPEHEKLVELLYQPIDARQFSRWHMAFSEPASSVLEEIANEMWTMSLPAVRAGKIQSPGLQHLLDFWDQANQER